MAAATVRATGAFLVVFSLLHRGTAICGFPRHVHLSLGKPDRSLIATWNTGNTTFETQFAQWRCDRQIVNHAKAVNTHFVSQEESPPSSYSDGPHTRLLPY